MKSVKNSMVYSRYVCWNNPALKKQLNLVILKTLRNIFWHHYLDNLKQSPVRWSLFDMSYLSYVQEELYRGFPSNLRET